MHKDCLTQSESFKDRRGQALLPERSSPGVSTTELNSVDDIFRHMQGLMWAGCPRLSGTRAVSH